MQPTLPGAVLSRLSELLAVRMGLHFPQERWADLERGIAAAAPVLGTPGVEACAQRLLSAPLTRSQIEVLASHLTVGETYFFRDESCFSALEQRVLPELLHKHGQGDGRVRIWCAGCCTGEEAYSISMLLDRLMSRNADLDAKVLATDINPAFLRKAAEGVYGQWSFRSAPDWVKPSYFRRHGDSRFEVRPALRERISFAYLNLVDDVYPSPANDTEAMDLIVCRNVLMYFTVAQARKVIAKLGRSLVPGGWLIVSPAETSTTLFSGYTAVEFPGAIFYRKKAAGERREKPPAECAVAPDPVAASRFPESSASTHQSSVSPREIVLERQPSATHANEPPAPPAGRHRQQARIYADQGRLAEAAECCEKAIADDRFDPVPQYLLAAIQQEMGRPDLAVLALTRALYLDPGFALAHFALGNLHLAHGRTREAEKSFRNALDLLAGRPQDEIVPESDGLRAGRLVEILASVLSRLPHAETAAT